jgi:hypothetical protein
MKTLKLALLIMIFISLGMLMGCHGGHMQKAEKDFTKKQIVWEPEISSDYFDPKVIYLEVDQGR